MTVYIDFYLDTKSGLEKNTVQSPYQDLGQTRDNLNSRLDETTRGPKALMPIRDADTGNYAFINLMKLASIEVRED